MPESVQEYKDQLEGRVMLVKKCVVLPVEAIVRGYITGVFFSVMRVRSVCMDINAFESWRNKDPLWQSINKKELCVISHYLQV